MKNLCKTSSNTNKEDQKSPKKGEKYLAKDDKAGDIEAVKPKNEIKTD